MRLQAYRGSCAAEQRRIHPGTSQPASHPPPVGCRPLPRHHRRLTLSILNSHASLSARAVQSSGPPVCPQHGQPATAAFTTVSVSHPLSLSHSSSATATARSHSSSPATAQAPLLIVVSPAHCVVVCWLLLCCLRACVCVCYTTPSPWWLLCLQCSVDAPLARHSGCQSCTPKASFLSVPHIYDYDSLCTHYV